MTIEAKFTNADHSIVLWRVGDDAWISSHMPIDGSRGTEPLKTWMDAGNSISAFVGPDLTEAKTQRVLQAWAHCRGVIESGVISGQSNTAATPVDHAFQMDSFTRESILTVKQQVQDGAASVEFFPLGETAQVEFTAAEWSAIANTAKTFVESKIFTYKAIEASIFAAADVDAVAAVDIEAGY